MVKSLRAAGVIVALGGPAILALGPCPATERSVEIDLNGFTVFADPAGGSVIAANCLESFVLRNGSIEPPPGAGPLPFGLGVDVSTVDKVVVDDLAIRDPGDTGTSFYQTGRSFAIRRNLIRGINFLAIYVAPSGANPTGQIEHNVITDCGGGIRVLGRGGSEIYALTIFIEFATRRVEIAGMTPGPNEAWMMQTGRNRRCSTACTQQMLSNELPPVDPSKSGARLIQNWSSALAGR